MEVLNHLEFLALDSKEIVEKQVDSYLQQYSYAGTIVGVTVLFIPFFLNGLDGTSQITQYITIAPIALFIWSMILMLSIFRSKAFDQALSVTKYEGAVIQILTEAIVIPYIGVSIGIMSRILSPEGVAIFGGWPVVITMKSALLSFLFSATVGVFFGWYPARITATLNPIDAFVL